MTRGRWGAEAPAGFLCWLISTDREPGRTFVLDLVELGRSLPVFSFREEAELFLALGNQGDGWRVVEGGTGDFLALFFGPDSDVSSVVLDPLPTMLRDSTASLVGMSLNRFMDRFLGLSEADAVAG